MGVCAKTSDVPQAKVVVGQCSVFWGGNHSDGRAFVVSVWPSIRMVHTGR